MGVGWGRVITSRSPEGHVHGGVSFLKWQQCGRTSRRGGKKSGFGEALRECVCTGEGAFLGARVQGKGQTLTK